MAGSLQGLRLLAWINFTAWIDKYIMCVDEITYPFPNFKGCTVEVWEWMSNFIPHFTGHVIIYPCWDLSLYKGPLVSMCSSLVQNCLMFLLPIIE